MVDVVGRVCGTCYGREPPQANVAAAIKVNSEGSSNIRYQQGINRMEVERDNSGIQTMACRE